MTDKPSYPALSVQNVAFSYPRGFKLRGVSFDVWPKQVVCIVGKSGCGKSTLLKLIAGLLPLAIGNVFFKGEDASRTPTHLRDLGFVFQSEDALFPHLNVRENIEFPFRRGGRSLPGRDWREAVRHIIERTDLQSHVEESVAKLSGGMKQRVALARALVYQPSIVLLDEPAKSLDNVRRRELVSLIGELRIDSDAAFVYVTHDDREVQRLADGVVALEDGAVVQQGTRRELTDAPLTDLVRELVSGKPPDAPSTLS